MLDDHRIDLNLAVQRTGNWRKYNLLHNPDDPQYIRAFRIPKQDILDLAQIPGTVGFRAYLTVEGDLAPSHTTILLVAILEDPSGKEYDLLSDASGSRVYDFTTPCPDSCDFESVLYKGVEEKPEIMRT